MQVTSNEANKLLKSYADELNRLLTLEAKSRTFTAATTENVEDARPVYDFTKTQIDINTVNAKIRKIKHAINVFNTTTVIPETEMTIDEALVYMPQLTRAVNKLNSMKNVLPKTRASGYSSKANIIEYEYTNYDIDEAVSLCDGYTKELARIQTALDTVNNTVKFEINLD